MCSGNIKVNYSKPGRNSLGHQEVNMADLKFQIVKSLGVIGEGKEGWRKEVNLVSWNDRKPKLDIREWDESHMKMKKGLTFNVDEMKELKSILSNLTEEIMEAEV
jgi:hypothetical protein